MTIIPLLVIGVRLLAYGSGFAPREQAIERKAVCMGSAPDGWVAVDYSYDATRCGGGTPSNGRGNQANVMTIERLDNRAKGARVRRCSGLPVSGWKTIETISDQTACRILQEVQHNNVMVIEKQ